jgi:aryl-alcohol dehydrogenase
MSYPTTAAIVSQPNGAFDLQSVDLADLAPGEILVDIDACGICHTDQKFQNILPLPAVLGHEGTGIVRETGAAVRSVHPGQRVILSYPFCTHCPKCLVGEPYRCENIPALKFGGKRLDGGCTVSRNQQPVTSAFFQQSSFAHAAIALEQSAVPVTREIAPEMLAALPCGVQTGAGAIMNCFKPSPGDPVLVIGAGTVGLSAVMAAKAVGAYPIICADVNAMRLDLATELGATDVVNVTEDDLVARVMEKTARGVRFALDTSATEIGLKNAIASIGQGGVVGIVSYPAGGDAFPFNTKELFLKVASIVSIVQGFSIPKLFLPKLIDLQAAGLFPYEKLISTYRFENINEAFEDMRAGTAIKPVLLMR